MRYTDIIQRLVDLERLAVLDTVGETIGQQTATAATCGGDTLITLAEMDGPGVIWRIWAAQPGPGRIRMYLDGNSQPVIDLPFAQYFRHTRTSFDCPALVYHSARGWNCYVPIPYQKSCKIVADPDWGQYAQFTYTRFPEQVEIPKFTGHLSASEKEVLDLVNEILSAPGTDPAGERPGAQTMQQSLTVSPGQTVQIPELSGSRAITSLKVDVDVGDIVPAAFIRGGEGPHLLRTTRRLLEDSPDRDALRELILQITWDGDSEPGVWAPLGDFFGSVPGWQQYRSLPQGMTTNGGYCYWYMPFERRARIELTNEGQRERRVTFTITHVPLSRPICELGRFHAKWHHHPTAALPLLEAEGSGRYVGAVVHASNPKGGNWSTSGERFFVDDKTLPCVQGIESEHYFGYAFSNPKLFAAAYHAEIACSRTGAWVGHTTAARFHIPDSPAFRQSFAAYLGDTGSDPEGITCAATTYWYPSAGKGDHYQPAPLACRTGYWAPPKIPGNDNVLEGEDLRTLKITGGTVTPLLIIGHGRESWSGRSDKAHLQWRDAAHGNTLDLALPVSKTRRYRIWTQLVQAVDHGIVQLSLNGTPVGSPINLYHNGMVPTGALNQGVHMLNQGDHVLRIEMISEDEKFENKIGCGLDYVWLEPLEDNAQLEVPEECVWAGDFKRIYDPGVEPYPTAMINDHCFVQDIRGTWHFFGITEGVNFAHATADTLTQIPWKKQPYAMTALWHPWGEIHLWAPHIILHNNTYWMFYCAGDKDPTRYKICLATSTDLWTWKRHLRHPLFVDGFDARDPKVLRVGNRWVMYYTANSTPAGGNYIVACRTSRNLLDWGERRTVFTDPARGRQGGPCESPFVVRRGEYYYLFIGPRRGYVGTEIFRSKDPFHWHVADRVGFVRAHAAEVVRDRDGEWYVSGAGVGQSGLYLAPLHWNDGLDDAEK